MGNGATGRERPAPCRSLHPSGGGPETYLCVLAPFSARSSAIASRPRPIEWIRSIHAEPITSTASVVSTSPTNRNTGIGGDRSAVSKAEPVGYKELYPPLYMNRFKKSRFYTLTLKSVRFAYISFEKIKRVIRTIGYVLTLSQGKNEKIRNLISVSHKTGTCKKAGTY